MSKFFKNTKKGNLELDVFHGWDIDLKHWFIDIKMTGFKSGNLVEWYSSKDSYKKTLEKLF